MFSKSKGEQNSSVEIAARQAPRPARGSAVPSIIGPDVTIIGNLVTSGEIQLDGRVEGDIEAGALTMGEKGTLKGSLVADSVTVKGHVDGAIHARTVVLERTAKVSGDVFHESLSIEAGATIDGRFSHGQHKPVADAKPAAPKPPEMAMLKGA